MNIKNNITGLQHIGLPTSQIEKSIEFYKSLGFEEVHMKSLPTESGEVLISFLGLKNLVIELYEIDENSAEKLNHGYIDHIALNVDNVKEVFDTLKKENYEFYDNEIQYLPLFENGVNYFCILGPMGEKIEFNQKL